MKKSESVFGPSECHLLSPVTTFETAKSKTENENKTKSKSRGALNVGGQKVKVFLAQVSAIC